MFPFQRILVFSQQAMLGTALGLPEQASWNKLEQVGTSWNKSCCLLNCIPRWWSASVAQAFRYFAIKNGEVVEVPFCYSHLLLRQFLIISWYFLFQETSSWTESFAQVVFPDKSSSPVLKPRSASGTSLLDSMPCCIVLPFQGAASGAKWRKVHPTQGDADESFFSTCSDLQFPAMHLH